MHRDSLCTGPTREEVGDGQGQHGRGRGRWGPLRARDLRRAVLLLAAGQPGNTSGRSSRRPSCGRRSWSTRGSGRSARSVEATMATFALIHGAGDVGWYWHLVEAELRARGHDAVAPDLPCDDDSAGLPEYADAVIDAIGDRSDLIVVAQSFGGFTAPLAGDRAGVGLLVVGAAMIPVPE